MAIAHPPGVDVAGRLVEIVERHYDAVDHLLPADLNEIFCYLGYVRAFRCFDSIRILAADGRSEDALILTRSLVSIALRTLYLVQPDDHEEREQRFKRYFYTSRAEEEKRLRMLNDPGQAKHLVWVQEELQGSLAWFEERSLSPEFRMTPTSPGCSISTRSTTSCTESHPRRRTTRR